MNLKFVIKDMENFKGQCYSVLVNNIDSITRESEADYIAKGYTVLSEEEFDRLNEKYEKSLCGKWSQITENFYQQQMDVLPPMFYSNGGFFISEPLIGCVHDFYQELDGKYYASLQRIGTKRENIIADLKKAITENQIEDRTHGGN